MLDTFPTPVRPTKAFHTIESQPLTRNFLYVAQGESLAQLKRGGKERFKAARKRIGKDLLHELADAWGYMIFSEVTYILWSSSSVCCRVEEMLYHGHAISLSLWLNLTVYSRWRMYRVGVAEMEERWICSGIFWQPAVKRVNSFFLLPSTTGLSHAVRVNSLLLGP